MTAHSFARMKSRCGTSKSASCRLADAAFTYGATNAEVYGRLNRYFAKVNRNGAVDHGRTSGNLRAYGDKLYVFSEDVLVTVLQLPPHFIPQVKRITAKKKG